MRSWSMRPATRRSAGCTTTCGPSTCLLGVVALQRSATRRQEVLAEHQAIVDGLVSGKPEAAEKAILSHLDTTGSLLMQG